MAARRNPNIMRAIRLQLKSGFMKVEPPEYTFMKRYPPMHRNTQPTFHELKTKNIPYLDLLEKAAEANPLYGESVYPAYWQHEPIGLTLAKKQYQFMQEGLDEAAAFRKAEEYVDDIESDSYEALKTLRDTLRKEGCTEPFVNDQDLTEELLFWQEKLQDEPYSSLDLADQGEVDYLIQTKILKWNEVERERRMTDPVFFKQFERLRAQLFPLAGSALEEENRMQIAAYRQHICNLCGVNYSEVTSSGPFYLEDYVQYFAQVKAQPDLRKWSVVDRARFTSWMNKTLAIKEVVENQDIDTVKSYLATLKEQFFPMIRVPEKAAQFKDLTVEGLKGDLYDNDVGYKTQDGKVFVRRYYRIPSLLFPQETLTAALVNDAEKLEHIVSENDEEALLRDIRNAGLEESTLPAVMADLKVYLDRYKMQAPEYNSMNGVASEAVGLSALDDLLNDAVGDAQEVPRHVKGSNAVSTEFDLDDLVATDDKAESLSGTGSDSNSEDASDGEFDGTASSSTSADSDDDSDNDDAEDSEGLPRDPKARDPVTEEMFTRYAKPVRSQLDNDREALYAGKVALNYEDAENEYGLMAAQSARLDAEADARAKLESVYEEKEGARRKRLWRRNKVWTMPRPVIPVQGMLEV